MIRNAKNLLSSKVFVLISDFFGRCSNQYIGAEKPSDIVAQYAKILSSCNQSLISNNAKIEPIAINQSASNANHSIHDIRKAHEVREK